MIGIIIVVIVGLALGFALMLGMCRAAAIADEMQERHYEEEKTHEN